MLLKCSRCGLESGPESFYLKYRDRTPVRRSDWASQCVECIKIFKRQFYQENTERINESHRSRRNADLTRVLELEAARRLAKSKNPDKILYRRSIVALDSTARYIHDRCVSWRSSAKKRSIPWSLTESEIREIWDCQGGRCKYTGLAMALEPNKPETVSLDRVDSSLGYSRENVVLCWTVVNKMKLDISLQRFKELIELLRNNLVVGVTAE